jgi:hypothetical protein
VEVKRPAEVLLELSTPHMVLDVTIPTAATDLTQAVRPKPSPAAIKRESILVIFWKKEK